MAASTLSLVSGRTFGWSLRTRDTVWWETPASRATSAITGGRARLPGPLTTDVIGRLLALSPGDRTTSCLPCRALCSQRSAGAGVSANIRTDQMAVRSIYTPTAPGTSAPPARFPASQGSRRTVPAVPARRQPRSSGVSTATDVGAPTSGPVVHAARRRRDLLFTRRADVGTCCSRGAPTSGLVAIGRAVPQVAERGLGLAPGLAVPQVLQRLPRLAPGVALAQILERLPGLAPRLALAQVADGRLGLA